MFVMCDRDKDGLLNWEDGNYLAKATKRSEQSEADWAALCTKQKCPTAGKMSKEDFWLSYTRYKMGNLEEDLPQVAEKT